MTYGPAGASPLTTGGQEKNVVDAYGPDACGPDLAGGLGEIVITEACGPLAGGGPSLGGRDFFVVAGSVLRKVELALRFSGRKGREKAADELQAIMEAQSRQ